ncbi:MAG: kelch repeat-containing protein [Gemmatimonadota bacterium]
MRALTRRPVSRLLLVLTAACGGGTDPNPPGPIISSFTASRDTITAGEHVTLTAVFSNGTGVVDLSVGPVSSGIGVLASPAGQPYTTTTFTLTVTNSSGATRTAQVQVTPVNAPVIRGVRALGTKAPAGGQAVLVVDWDRYPGHVPSVAGASPAISDSFFLVTLPASGSVSFTASIRSPADSIVTATTTVSPVTPAAGSFQPTGSLGTARMGAAVTELKDGRVLVAGGSNGQPGAGFTAAEIYDPLAGQFTSTGSLGKPRTAPLAVTLNDGRVLLVGPDGQQGTSSELYDTATGQFAPGPNTSFAGIAGIARLGDGRVFILTANTTAEIFDPTSDSFTVAVSSGTPMTVPGVVLLLDGRILLAETIRPSPGASVPAQIFDPATGLFTPTGSMAQAHLLGTFTRLANGKVLVAGGIDTWNLQFSPNGELFDPATDTWSLVGLLALPRYSHSAALLNDGRILLVGGQGGSYVDTPFAELFDPTTGEFTPLLGTLGGSRQEPMTLRLSDGRVLLMGGLTGSPRVVTSLVEIFQ